MKTGLIIALVIVLTLGALTFVSAKTKKGTGADAPSTDHRYTKRQYMQAAINGQMQAPAVVHELSAGIKTGGEHGVKADLDTTKQWIWGSITRDITGAGHPQDIVGGYNDYNYPGIEAYVDSSAKPGTGRDKTSGGGIGGIVSNVISAAAGFVPGGNFIKGTLTGLVEKL